MEDFEFLGDDIIGQIDWDSFFDDLPEDGNAFSFEPSTSPSPDSVSPGIDEIVNFLLKDDDDNNNSVAEEPSKELCDSFFADILVASPVEVAGEVVDASSPIDKDCSSDSDDGNGNSEKEKVNSDVQAEDEADDPQSKKRRRQLRNRDAAVKSRERKKMYVRDLELKSRYLEGECRRLGHLLQCCYSENQALRLSLQSGNAFGASMTKQESAVLLLESLLLGSLLWFLGIMCLFTMPQLILEIVPLENVGQENPGVPLRGPRSKMFGYLTSFVKSRRCKASRTKMKPSYLVL
ncbi:bZIP transcription factor 60 [Fagus crenata]